jgi:hypothetical protein
MGRERRPVYQVVTLVGILLGVLLGAGGFVARGMAGQVAAPMEQVALGLWAAGLLLAAIGVIANRSLLLRLVTGRGVGEKANFAATVLLAVALAGILCYISTRRFARLDWTGMQTYALAAKTKNILRALEREVQAVLMLPGGQTILQDPLMAEASDRAMDMLEEFSSYSPSLQVRRVFWTDPQEQQEVERIRQRVGPDIPSYSVIFMTEDADEIVPLGNVVTRSPMGLEFTGEDAFAEALIKLTEEERATLYFLTGHGERPLEARAEQQPGGQAPAITAGGGYSLSRFARALRKDNYEVKELNLTAEGSVPADCQGLVIAGPRSPFSEAEMKALEEYLFQRSGGALVLVDPQAVAGAETNVAELLEPTGIRPRTDAVGTTNAPSPLGTLQTQQVFILSEGMASHPVTRGLHNYSLSLQQPCPLQIAPAPQGPGSLSAQKLLWTDSESTWGETAPPADRRRAARYDPDRDVGPPLTVAAVVAPPEPPPGMPRMPGRQEGPRVVVIGSSASFVNMVVEQQLPHLYLLQNAANWMAGKLHKLDIPPKTIELDQVPVSERTLVAARYFFIAGLPACIVALGLFVWLMRRR